MSADRGRFMEDVGFGAAILIALLYGSAEAAARAGWCHSICIEQAPFPYGLAIVELILALPKMIGRVSAGRVWEAIAARRPGAPDA